MAGPTAGLYAKPTVCVPRLILAPELSSARYKPRLLPRDRCDSSAGVDHVSAHSPFTSEAPSKRYPMIGPSLRYSRCSRAGSAGLQSYVKNLGTRPGSGNVNHQFSSRPVEFGPRQRFPHVRERVNVVDNGFQLPFGNETP